MNYIKVKNTFFTMSGVQSSKDGKHWEAARPATYTCNIIERIKHGLGKHWSYGQPYCVVCGREEA